MEKLNNTIEQNILNDIKNNFIFISDLIGISIYSLDNKYLGKIRDLVATSKETYPRITGFITKENVFSWIQIRNILPNRMVVIDNAGTNLTSALQEDEFLLKETLLDKQIVDISGSKVVRVNDLHILKENLTLWLVHVDIGFKGILRRMGWLNLITGIIQWLFSYEMKDKYISWKYVQPISSAGFNKNPVQLKIPQTKLIELHPADLADIISELGSDEKIVMFKSLDTKTAARTLMELDKKIRITVAESMDKETLSALLNEMPVDEAVDLLNELTPRLVNQALHLMNKERVSQIRDLISHSDNIAGSIMNTDFISVPSTFTVEQALSKIKELSKKYESIYYTYVCDEKDILIGVTTIRQLINADPVKPVLELMKKRLVKVRVDTSKKTVSQLFMKYNFDVIPVVDKQNKILGIITLKDALESTYPELTKQTI